MGLVFSKTGSSVKHEVSKITIDFELTLSKRKDTQPVKGVGESIINGKRINVWACNGSMNTKMAPLIY